MQTLIIIAHPNINNARVNKRWHQELLKYPQQFVIHELYKEYPDWQIDVEREQKLLEQYDTIIFQMPFYWYSYPPLLKKWFDEVFTHGWAYGSNSKRLHDKKMAIALSIGDKEANYAHNRPIEYTVAELLAPFKATTNHIGAKYSGYHCIYGSSFQASDAEIEQNSRHYIDFLEKI